MFASSPAHRPKRQWSCVLSLVVLALACVQGAQAQRYGRNKVQYENFDWKVLSTPHFEIFFYEEEADLAARAAIIAEDAYLRLSQLFDHEFSSQVPFILYASPNDFQQTNIASGLIGESTGGFSEPLRNRMVLPYPGDNEGFIHVINHELVHVFMFDVAWAGTKSAQARRALFPIPLWFAEGAAEWFSAGWDQQADMWMRDATVHSWLIPLHRITGGYQVYKEGQAAMRYMAEVYGQEKVVEFFKSVGRTQNVERSMEQTFGMKTEEFSEQWETWLKRQYWPLFDRKQEIESIGDRLTDHSKKRNYFYQQPTISPDGRFLAYFSDDEAFPQLYVMDAIERKVLRKLVTGHRSDQFLSLHSFESSMSFSPQSDRLAFVARSGGDEVLYIVRIDDGEVVQRVPLSMDIARSPAWSPVAESVVLSGTRGGQTDLYLVDLHESKLRALTESVADEHSPAWFPDGQRIVYSTFPNTTVQAEFARDERGVERLSPVDFKSDVNVERAGITLDLAVLDLASGSSSILVSTPGSDTDPVLVDANTLLFVSDQNGIQNLHQYRLDTGELRRLTDVLGGIFHPSVAQGDKLVFAAFNDAGWDIFLCERFLEYSASHDFPQSPETKLSTTPQKSGDEVRLVLAPDDESGRSLLALPVDLARGEITQQRQAGEGPDSTSDRQDTPAPAIAGDSDPAQASSEPDTLDTRDPIAALDHEAAAKPSFEPRRPIGTVEKYRLRFSLDPVGGVGGVSYTNGVGLGLANQLSLSDLLGNHRMSFLLSFYGSIKYSDLAASYAYLKRRVNLAGGVFHYRNYINSSFTSLGEIYDRSQLFSERNYGVFGLASLPLSQFDRVDFELQAFESEKTFYDTPDGYYYYEIGSERNRLIQPSLSYVHDSAFYGQHGPVTGTRWTLSIAPALPLSTGAVDRTTTFGEFRRYGLIFGRQSLGLRVVAAQSTGGTPRQFVVGGPSTLRGWDIFDFEERNASGQPKHDNLLGNRMVLMNLEYRFPLIDALYLGWPGRFGIGGIGGAVFFDTGSAFEGKFRPFGKTADGDFALADLNADYGFGIRANLGFLPLKFDWAWQTDLDRTEPHVQFNFSIAPEF